jgi:hypothetical protein
VISASFRGDSRDKVSSVWIGVYPWLKPPFPSANAGNQPLTRLFPGTVGRALRCAPAGKGLPALPCAANLSTFRAFSLVSRSVLVISASICGESPSVKPASSVAALFVACFAFIRVHSRFSPPCPQCKKRRAGQQVRPFHTDAPENQCINNDTTIPDPRHPTSHQNW